MSYLRSVQDAGEFGGQYHWVLLGTIVAAVLLAVLLPTNVRRLRITAFLAFLSLPMLLVCGWMLQHGADPRSDATYRWLHFAAQWSLAIALINLLGVLVFRVILVALRLQAPPILRDTILGIAYILVAISLLSRHDVNLSGIIATSAVVTAVIGFSLQDTLGNIMGGVALQMERSIAVGDWIRIGDVEGLVHEIRWRQTSVETRNWDTVVIPNSVLMKSQVTVLGRRSGKPRQHRMTVPFSVDQSQPPTEVIEAVQQALRAEPIPGVAIDPPADCQLVDFKDGSSNFAVRYYLTDIARDTPTSSEVRTRIYFALQRAHIELSTPTQNLSMTLQNRSREQRQRQEELDRRVAALKGVQILKGLTDEERREIAEQMTVAPFRKGEIMTRQGNVAHFLYIVTRGNGEVRLDTGNGAARTIGQIHTGDVFGEMGLMTGEPRSATVVATSDVVCYRLDREAFAAAIQRRPALAEEISMVLARRKVELDAAKAGIATDAMANRMKDTQGELLRRIRNFFRLES
jgi:small-conductance mechanosensitive channel/CRP-like cAMP-binding protein